MNSIDLRPLIDQIVIPIMIPIGVSLFLWGLRQLNNVVIQHFKLKIDEKQRDAVDRILQNLITGVLTTAAGKLDTKPLTIQTKGTLVAEVAQKAVAHAPDTLAHFGVTAANDPKLATMIEDRIAAAVAPAPTITAAASVTETAGQAPVAAAATPAVAKVA